PRWVSTSPGRYDDPDGRFSAIGTVAVTVTGSSRVAAAITVATTAAAPAMSLVIWSMPAAGLIEMPPESNVTPLPTRATEATDCAGRYDRRTSRGGRVDPEPTARMPPYPPRVRPASVSTCTRRPAVRPALAARSAN